MFHFKKGGSPPPDAVGLGFEHSVKIYLAVAHVKDEDIPCKVHNNGDCWYALNGEEDKAEDFSWVCATEGNLKLFESESLPPFAVRTGMEQEGGDMYAIIANTVHGQIPGKATSDGSGYYGINGKETKTSNFFWVVMDK